MKNRYEIMGEYTKIFLGKKEDILTFISTDDLEKVKEFPGTWNARWSEDGHTYYVVGRKQKESIFMHRWITNAPKGWVVDHFNADTLDNSRDNLRVVTHKVNMQNRTHPSKFMPRL